MSLAAWNLTYDGGTQTLAELAQLQALFSQAANGKFQEINSSMAEQKRQIEQLQRNRTNHSLN
jgi:hypothetical protein